MTTTLLEQRHVPQEIEIDREIPSDISDYELIFEAQRLLELDENRPDVGIYLKRKALRRIRRVIEARLEASQDIENFDADNRLVLASTYAQVLNAYANLMTSFNPDGSIYVHYNDVAHASPLDYGQPDPHFSELNHVSQQELVDRSITNKLGEELVKIGYITEALLETMTISDGALTERFSNLAWYSPLGDQRKQDLAETVSRRIERYLPLETIYKKLGFDATLLQQADSTDSLPLAA